MGIDFFKKFIFRFFISFFSFFLFFLFANKSKTIWLSHHTPYTYERQMNDLINGFRECVRVCNWSGLLRTNWTPHSIRNWCTQHGSHFFTGRQEWLSWWYCAVSVLGNWLHNTGWLRKIKTKIGTIAYIRTIGYLIV